MEIEALVMYLKSCDCFIQLMTGFKAKYESYGRFAGKVKVDIQSSHDLTMLEGLMHRSYHGQNQVTISADTFLKALSKGRYANIDPKTLLDAYFGYTIQSNVQQKYNERIHRINQLNQVKNTIPSIVEPFQQRIAHPLDIQRVIQWFDQCIQWFSHDDALSFDGQSILNCLLHLDKENRCSFKETLPIVAILLAILPLDGVYLSVVAAWLCHDPHAFDRGNALENLLMTTIRYCSTHLSTDTTLIDLFPAYQREHVMLDGGILINDLSNTVTIAGLQAKDSNGCNHIGLQDFYDHRQSIQLSLSMIRQLNACYVPNHRLFIVENPSIYSLMFFRWDGSYGLMCANGQPRLSTLTILEKMKDNRTQIYYGGDFDPEGLLIAQKLCTFYGDGFHFWHMAPDDYEAALPNKPLRERRIKMLKNITESRLIDTAKRIREHKKAGYQEAIWERYINDPLLYSKNG